MIYITFAAWLISIGNAVYQNLKLGKDISNYQLMAIMILSFSLYYQFSELQ